MDSLEHDESQLRAIDMILRARVGIVTGGPGTGKTTCLRTALTQLPPNCHVRLAAPTGKAARRMAEATHDYVKEHPTAAPCTIHRLLEFKPNIGFTRSEHRPVGADLIVVDEASMIDINLAAELFSAVGRARLVMMGDVNQLPPVGPGQPFADVIRSGVVPVTQLTKLHRQAAESWVARSAPRVLAGERIDLRPRHDFRFVPVALSSEIMPTLKRIIAEEGASVETQLLIPQRTGLAGTYAANAQLQDVFNNEPPRQGDAYLPRQHYNIRVGDRVIQTANDYGIEVFNGEVGELVEADANGVTVLYPDGDALREVRYTAEQSDNLELAYALTVHRAQGSEFPTVVCVVHSTHTRMLTRRLFYTAMTRTRGRLVIVGDEVGIERAIANTAEVQRRTTLVERLHGTLEPVTDDSQHLEDN
jgi:exodeoxyribonuclease V alpha subunit